ncbi:MAG: hypothetical protein KME16_14270 [Scytolyngbya sp. HA4215-MV1]|nr:hypothetical protein [Scytolyngbya sp. HA4215-MV1]
MTFEQGLALTQDLLTEIEQGNGSEAEIEAAIASLVSSENGARAFFVVYLAGSSSLADDPSSGIIRALQTAPEVVAELLVKNLAMSTAMAITHHRSHASEMAAGSERVERRTVRLIQQVQLPLVREKAQALLESLTLGSGHYQGFLDRLGYDVEQRQAIRQNLRYLLADD